MRSSQASCEHRPASLLSSAPAAAIRSEPLGNPTTKPQLAVAELSLPNAFPLVHGFVLFHRAGPRACGLSGRAPTDERRRSLSCLCSLRFTRTVCFAILLNSRGVRILTGLAGLHHRLLGAIVLCRPDVAVATDILEMVWSCDGEKIRGGTA